MALGGSAVKCTYGPRRILGLHNPRIANMHYVKLHVTTESEPALLLTYSRT